MAIGRKNFLFFGSLRGGQAAATLYSVVQSARLYHVDVMAYLTDVLRRLPAIAPTDTAAITPLLPDHWAAAHPQHVHASRDQELQAAATRRRQSRARRRAMAKSVDAYATPSHALRQPKLSSPPLLTRPGRGRRLGRSTAQVG